MRDQPNSMRTALITPMQEAEALRIATLLSCPDDIIITWAPDLPMGWVVATIGRRKGRQKDFYIDREGVTHR
jgi:hypothetical protein